MEWMMMLRVVMVTTYATLLQSNEIQYNPPWSDVQQVCNRAQLAEFQAICTKQQAQSTQNNPSWPEVEQVCNRDQLAEFPAICTTRQLSCRSRCNVALIKDKNITDEPSCYCDARCPAYGDCCHDFEQTCKMENETYFTAFFHRNQPKTKCLLNNYTVIDSCLERTDTRGKDEHLHSMDHVVTDGLTGLHFTNYTIFSCNREPNSRAIFWNKELGSTLWGPVSKPVPPPQIDRRECNTYFRMSCDMICNIKGYASYFGTLCQTIPQYNPHIMKPQIDLEHNKCGFSVRIEGKNPIYFSYMVRISGVFEIVTPINSLYSSWGEAECFSGVSSKTCRVRKCQDGYVQIGQTCLIPLGINITLEFNSDLERKLFDENTFLGLLGAAWGGLKNNFTFTLESSEAEGNMYQVLYELLNVTYIKDDQDQLPFTQQIVTELENVIEEDPRQVKIIPTTVKVCVNVEINLMGQMETQLNDSSPMPLYSSSRYVCDVITLFNSESASDWLISSEYNKIAGAMMTGKNGGNSMMRCRLFSGCAMPLVVFLFGVYLQD